MYWSGDLAYRDADGFVYFAGRSGDWLRVDGENLAAAPIERILLRHPDVSRVAVYAVPDTAGGDQVIAALVLRDGAGPRPRPASRSSWPPAGPRRQAVAAATSGSRRASRRPRPTRCSSGRAGPRGARRARPASSDPRPTRWRRSSLPGSGDGPDVGRRDRPDRAPGDADSETSDPNDEFAATVRRTATDALDQAGDTPSAAWIFVEAGVRHLRPAVSHPHNGYYAATSAAPSRDPRGSTDGSARRGSGCPTPLVSLTT